MKASEACLEKISTDTIYIKCDVMTIRELYSIIQFADERKRTVKIGTEAGDLEVNLYNDLNMAAFGDFAVGSVMALGEDDFEINLSMKPVKSGEVK